MLPTSSSWDQLEPALRSRAYEQIDRDPHVLLEHDSWFHVDADLFHARLLGFEDEIVNELWLSRAEPFIEMPIPDWSTPDPREISPGVYDLDGVKVWIPSAVEELRVAVYRLQSSYVTLSVDGDHFPPDQQRGPDGTVRICYLKYRRRA